MTKHSKSQKGYRTLKARPHAIQLVLDRLESHGKAEKELLSQIKKIPIEEQVTKTEIIRDLGFTRTDFKLLTKFGTLLPAETNGSRTKYSFQEVLRLRVQQSGMCAAPTLRVNRSRTNIVSVLHDLLERVINGRT
jgi:hypothetical protein